MFALFRLKQNSASAASTQVALPARQLAAHRTGQPTANAPTQSSARQRSCLFWIVFLDDLFSLRTGRKLAHVVIDATLRRTERTLQLGLEEIVAHLLQPPQSQSAAGAEQMPGALGLKAPSRPELASLPLPLSYL